MNQDQTYGFASLLPRVFPQWLATLGLVGVFAMGFLLGLLYGRVVALARSFPQDKQQPLEQLEHQPSLTIIPQAAMARQAALQDE